VDECGAAGGGTVHFAAGRTFLTGCFNVSSNTILQIDGTILGSPNSTGYVLVDPLPWYGPDPPQKLAARNVAQDPREWQPLISSFGASNISILGTGVVDGQGEPWWGCASNMSLAPCSGYPRPHGIRLVGGSGFEIAGITVKDSPMWQVHLAFVTDVHVHDMAVLAPATSHNTDGIDPDCAQDVLIERVRISTGDDNIAVKSGRNWYGRTFGRPSRNITVRDSVFGTGHGISIGSEMSGDVYDVLFQNISGTGMVQGVRIKSERGRGGLVANVTYRDIRLSGITGEAVQLTMNYDPGLPPTNATATPRLRNVTLDGVVVDGSAQGWLIDGLPESKLEGLVLRNVSLRGVTKALVVGCDYLDAASSACDAATVLPACPPCFLSQPPVRVGGA